MISILMPIYNGIEFIEESVRSVINQTNTNWQLIIGINGHSKNSDVYKKSKEYEINHDKIRVLDLFNIKGKSNALNEMIHYCLYDYVAILDVDDVWYPKKLEVQSEYLFKYDIIGSKCIYFGDRLNGVIPDIPIRDLSDFDFTKVNPIINSSSITKKELCYWNNNGIEDYDLWLRLKKQNKKFYNCEEILLKHRIHNLSAFNSKGHHNLIPNLLQNHLQNN